MKKIILLMLALLCANARSVIDHNGDSIELEGRVNRVLVQSGYPIPSVFAIFDGSIEHLVGIPKTSMAAAKYSLLAKVFPDITKISTDYDSGGNVVNVEEIMKLNPDVVFYYADNKISKEGLKNANIKSVGFGAAIYKNNSLKVFEAWLNLMGELTQKTSEASKIIDFAYDTESKIKKRIEKTTKKPTALVIMHFKNGKLMVAGSDHYSEYWLNATGAINIAKFKGTKEMNLEELYRLDPDIIYITNFTPLMPQDMKSQIDGLDFSKLKAVVKNKVYKFPLGMYRWYPPASDAPLSLMWLAKHNQPELFKDIDMKKETRKFYKTYYRLDLSDKELEQIFNPSREAGNV